MLPVLAAVAFLMAIAVARPRSRGVLLVDVAVAVAGAVLAIALQLVRELALDRLDDSGTPTAVQVRDAARDVYDAYSATCSWGAGARCGWAPSQRRGRRDLAPAPGPPRGP